MRTKILACVIAIGCPAWMPATLAQTDPGAWVPAPEGTVTVFQRTSNGSYGNFEGEVKWTLDVREWNGRPLLAAVSERHGITLHDPLTHGVKVLLTSTGQPTTSFNPELRHEWPLAVGKSWISVHEMTDYRAAAIRSLTMTFKVEAYEDVTVPAGTFKAYRVMQASSFGEVERNWVVPSRGLATVKRIADRPSMHPLGAGHLEAVMLSRSEPPR